MEWRVGFFMMIGEMAFLGASKQKTPLLQVVHILC